MTTSPQGRVRRVLAALTVGVVLAIATPGSAVAAEGGLFDGFDNCQGAAVDYENTATASGTAGGTDVSATDNWSATFGGTGTCVGVVKLGRTSEGDKPVSGAQFEVLADNAGQPGAVIESATIHEVPDRVGAIVIEGLGPGTYWLREVKAPQGHTLLGDPIIFTISSDGVLSLSSGNPRLVSLSDEDSTTTGPDTLMVVNLRALTLPLVGGTAVAFGIVGGAVVVVGVAAAARRKKRKRA